MADTAMPFRDRPFQAFLSHAHADKMVVDRLHKWLTETAALPIWYDAIHLPAGARIATELGNALTQCKAAIIVLSKASVTSGWVEDEWNIASTERNRPDNQGGFRIIPIRIEECEIPSFLGATKYIDLAAAGNELDTHAELLSAFYFGEADVQAGTLDIYVSRSWRSGPEQVLADRVCQRLAKAKLRLIGDSPDWPNFEGQRIQTIMRSCDGLAAIVPNRLPREKLRYFIEEIDAARKLSLPMMIVAEAGADLPDAIGALAIKVPMAGQGGDDGLEVQIDEAIQDLAEACRNLDRPHHVFLATDLDERTVTRNRIVQRLLQRVTGLSWVVGEKIHGDGIQKSIVQRIQESVAMIADITGDNLNICIEAGVARGARVPLHLIAQGERRSPPFMLRDIEPAFYQDDIELLGVAHRIARPYRRKVLAFGTD